MTLKQAIESLKEMLMIEERLLAMLTTEGTLYHEDDMKAITSKIFEVSNMILQLQRLIEQAKREHRGE